MMKRGLTNKPLRILVCSENVAPQVNGIAFRVSHYVDNFRDLGHQVDILHPESQDVWSHTNPWNSTAKLMLIKPWRLLNLMLTASNYDIVHVVLPLNLSSLWILAGHKLIRWVGSPDKKDCPDTAFVLSWHCNIEDYIAFHCPQFLNHLLRIVVFGLLCRPLSLLADRILLPTASSEPLLVQTWPSSRVGLSHTGIDESFLRRPGSGDLPQEHTWLQRKQAFLQETSRKYLLLYVGRLSPEKSVGDLLSALAFLPDCALWIVGDGPSRFECERQARDLKLPVHFWGYQSGGWLSSVYRAADCFVSPSQTETFGQTIQEAIASESCRIAVPRLPPLKEAYGHILPADAFWEPNDRASMVKVIQRQCDLVGSDKEGTAGSLPTWKDASKKMIAEYKTALTDVQGHTPRMMDALAVAGLVAWMCATAFLSIAILAYSQLLEAITAKHKGSTSYQEELQTMRALDMLRQQLRLFALRKNIDSTWKALAKRNIHSWILILYVASSFAYSLAGLQVLQHLQVLKESFVDFPWHCFGVYLMLQGLITFFSDVVYVDRPCIWHPVDRCSAMIGIGFTIWSLVRMATHPGVIVYAIDIAASFASFAYEWHCKQRGDLKMFLLAHTGWHLFGPLAFCCWVVAA